MKLNINSVKVPKEVERVIINNYFQFCKGILNKYNKGDKSVWVKVTEDKGDVIAVLVSPRKKNIEERYSLDKLSDREFNSKEHYCKYLYNVLKIFTELNLDVDKISANVKDFAFKSIFITECV